MTPVDAPITRTNLSIASVGITEAPEILEALLGSCVAIVLWDKTERRGAMGHCLLPEGPDSFDGPQGKYVNTAIREMLRLLTARGSNSQRIVAKLVGGAKMFGKAETLTIGARNVEAAKRILSEHGIPLVASHIGGTVGRKILFSPADGEVEIWNGPRLLETL